MGIEVGGRIFSYFFATCTMQKCTSTSQPNLPPPPLSQHIAFKHGRGLVGGWPWRRGKV